MRALDYAFRQGWSSLWRSRGSSAFAVAAIALAIVVLGTILLLTWNAERVVGQWTTAAEFSVYLRDGASSEERGAIEEAIDASGAAAGRDFVSKAQALQRFRREFAELAAVAEGFADNPFPASVEVRLRGEAESDGRADALVRQLTRLPGVADVQYDRDWLARISSGLRTFRMAGLALGLLMAATAAVTVATVVRLGLYARRDEIEIMELVGAPAAYVRGPFIAEGFLQGGLGALLALLLLAAGLAAVNAAWGTQIAQLLDGGELRFLPPSLAVYLVAGGTAVGSAGGWLAARHAG